MNDHEKLILSRVPAIRLLNQFPMKTVQHFFIFSKSAKNLEKIMFLTQKPIFSSADIRLYLNNLYYPSNSTSVSNFKKVSWVVFLFLKIHSKPTKFTLLTPK